MSKDLHNMDEIFNSAYRQVSEDPSPQAWERINAGLDKRDAWFYKRKLKNWKRVAILSLLLLSGTIFYEVVIVKSIPGYSNRNIPEAGATKSGSKSLQPADNSSQAVISRQNNANENSSLVNASNGAKHNANANISGDAMAMAKSQSPGTLVTTDGNVSKAANNDKENLLIALLPTVNDGKKSLGDEEKLSRGQIPVLASGSIAEYVSEKQAGQVPVYLNIVPQAVLQQPSTSTNQNSGRLEQSLWTISATISSDHPGYRLDKDVPTIAKIKEHETHEPSFSAAILLTRRIKGRFALQSGLIYSNIGITISPQQIYASPNQNGNVLYKYVVSSGYAYIKPGFASVPSPGDSLTAGDGQHSLKYIAVPLIARYYLINNSKLILSPGLGLAGNFLTSATVETELAGSSSREHVSIGKLDGIRTFNWSITGDLTLQYFVIRKLSIDLRPFFSYAISPITHNNDVETFPYNFGLGAGASYRF